MFSSGSIYTVTLHASIYLGLLLIKFLHKTKLVCKAIFDRWSRCSCLIHVKKTTEQVLIVLHIMQVWNLYNVIATKMNIQCFHEKETRAPRGLDLAENNNTCKGPWVIHIYQVSSKSIKRFWRRSWKCESLRTDNGRRTMTIAHLSLRVRWAKKM